MVVDDQKSENDLNPGCGRDKVGVGVLLGCDNAEKPKSAETGPSSNMAESEVEAKEAARARLTYDKSEGKLDLGNIKSTDYKYNRYINLPKPNSAKAESMHEYRRSQMLRVFDKVTNLKVSKTVETVCKEKPPSNAPLDKKSRNSAQLSSAEPNSVQLSSVNKPKNVQMSKSHDRNVLEYEVPKDSLNSANNEVRSGRAEPNSVASKKNGKSYKDAKNEPIKSNLSKSELRGLKSLKKRVSQNEIVVCETDKSKKFAVLTRKQYEDAGKAHVDGDILVDPEEIKSVQKVINDHCFWLREIFQFGVNWDQKERMDHNMADHAENVAPLRLLIKDHKGWTEDSGLPPPSRPVCAGNSGGNRHISEIVSLILEPVACESEGNISIWNQGENGP